MVAPKARSGQGQSGPRLDGVAEVSRSRSPLTARSMSTKGTAGRYTGDEQADELPSGKQRHRSAQPAAECSVHDSQQQLYRRSDNLGRFRLSVSASAIPLPAAAPCGILAALAVARRKARRCSEDSS